MNINKTVRKLGYADNPKAGMFVGMTLVALLLCVIIPALGYVAFAAPPLGATAALNWSLADLFIDDFAVWSLPLALLLLFTTLQTWHYYFALLRTVFASKRR
jgi:hypothetical protein